MGTRLDEGAATATWADRMAAFAPAITTRMGEIDARRGIPGDLAVRLAEAGAYHLLTPTELGGPELSPQDAYRAMEALGRIDMSVGWCSMIGSTSALGLAYLPVDIGRSLVPALTTILCGVAAPTGKARLKDGSYAVSGRWQWGSSSNNAEYVLLGCLVEQAEAPPAYRVIIVPSAKVQRPDTWHTMGLAGTSSGDLVVEQAVVPAAWSFDPFSDSPQHDGALYRMPYLSTLGLGVAAVCLGNAAGAMDDLMTLAREKTPAGMPSTLASHPFAQTRLVELSCELAAARALFYDTVEQVWAKADARDTITPEDRARLRMVGIYATRAATAVTRGAYEVAGGTSVFSGHPLQRRLRDGQVGAQHRMVSEIVFPAIGKTLFGLGSHAFLDQHRI